MDKNKELWRKARLGLCASLFRMLKQPCLVSLKLHGEAGTKTIDLTPEQANTILQMIQKETEVAV